MLAEEVVMMEAVKEFHIDSGALLNALPFFAMVLDADHHVVQANTCFAREVVSAGACPLGCYSAEPHPHCPLSDAVRTGRPAECVIADERCGDVRISVYPLGAVGPGGENLYLHFARPA